MLVKATAGDVLSVVVVDDHRDVALAVAFALDALGHRARAAHDGETALAAVRELAPDLVIADIALPRMDGWELARAIRGLALPHPPRLVAMSGYDSELDRERSAAAGYEQHIAKPVEIADLVRACWPGD